MKQRWRLLLIALGLFLLNAYICRELFFAEFLNNLDSNEGVFTAIGRFYREHPFERWYPWFNAGMPIENAYQPLLPALTAVTSLLTGMNAPRSLHFLLAVLYCLGPVTLFWFAWDWSKSLRVAVGVGLAYSLLSPAEWFIPILRLPHFGPLRLYNIVHYAEDPHNLALTLLPVAFLFLRRAIATRSPGSIIGAIISSACVVSVNAFGGIDLVLGGLAIVLAMGSGLGTLVALGVAAYCWMSPWLSPSLINLIRGDQWGEAGVMHASYLATAAAIAIFAALVWFTRRVGSELERFALYLGYWLCLIPISFFLFNITFVPQGGRYQIEMELAICLLLAVAANRLPARGTWALIAVVVVGSYYQTKVFRRFARGLIQPIDITKTIQYKTCMWLDKNMPDQRAMVSGDTEFICNIYSNNPQLSSGHQPSAPNWMQKVAVYGIYTGTPTGAGDAEISILWLKAFATQAITVPGPKSREHYHPVLFPNRFEGVLPELWHDEDDTIYGVPQKSKSLARVVPKLALVQKAPIHGLDVDPLRPFVAALDDPALPVAEYSGEMIRANMKPDQVISLAINHAPGWEASVGGREVPVTKDAIGLMVIEPNCNGPCEISIHYGVTTEAWVCRLLSALVTLGMLLLALVPGISAAVRKAPRLQPSPR